MFERDRNLYLLVLCVSLDQARTLDLSPIWGIDLARALDLWIL